MDFATEPAPHPATLRRIAVRLSGLDPALRLLMGPQASEAIRRMKSSEASLADVAILEHTLGAAEERGYKLGFADQGLRPQFLEMVNASRKLRSYVDRDVRPGVSLELPPLIANPERSNPQKVLTFDLAPADEDQQVLAVRVVGIYEPVFPWEPRIKISTPGEHVIVQLSGEDKLVEGLQRMIFDTLGANAYRGTWKSAGRSVDFPRSTNALALNLLR